MWSNARIKWSDVRLEHGACDVVSEALAEKKDLRMRPASDPGRP
jgi:hypothetical protein